VFGVYLASPVSIQSDSIWTIPTAASVWLRGDTDLDEYAPTAAHQRHGILERAGHLQGYFPVAPALTAVPVVAVLDLCGRPLGLGEAWRARLRAVGDVDYAAFDTTERFVASLWTALGVTVFFLMARRQASPAAATLVTAVLAFGTSAYSTASRVLWQHGPSLLAICAVIALLRLRRPARGWGALTGLAVALAYAFRPTNSVTVLLVTGLMAWKHRAQLWPYLAGASAVAVPFVASSLSTFGSVLPPYFAATRLSPGGSTFGEALLGNLVSPGRGLLVFSPILLVAVLSAIRRAFRGELDPTERVFALAVLLHWIVISSFPHWWGGHSIGPRLFTDALPYLAYFLIAPVDAVLGDLPRRRLAATALGLLATVSIFVHARGATVRAVHGWNDGPPNVDAAPARLWDWSDLQFLRR